MRGLAGAHARGFGMGDPDEATLGGTLPLNDG